MCHASVNGLYKPSRAFSFSFGLLLFFFMSSKNLLGDLAFQISLKFKLLNFFLLSQIFSQLL